MNKVPDNIMENLNGFYPLTPEQVAFYDKYRYIKLKQVLDSESLSFFNDEISLQVQKMITNIDPIEERDTYGKAFLQLFNLWRESDSVKALVFSKRIAGIAAGLLQTRGVRLYHDQALFKEGGGGITPWHADQYYWPLASDKTVTAWIPLQKTGLEMGPLEFSAGSHVIVDGRELAIGDESENLIRQKLKITDFQHVIEPFDAGEISFHSGWIFHRAGANTTPDMRKVMTIIYMDSEMRLKEPENKNQEHDRDTWCPGAVTGAIIDSPLNPVLYER